MPPLTPESNIIRARNVSASEVGALLDKHPYMTAGAIYDRLSDPIAWEAQRDPQNESMALGSYMEPYIARYAARKLGLRLRANRYTREYRGWTRLCATADYLVLGHPMLVEVKLSSIMYGWADETLAPHIEWQARAQMAVWDRDVVIVAALVGARFYSIAVLRDAEKERRMLQAVDKLWDSLRLGQRPQEMETKVSKVTIGAS